MSKNYYTFFVGLITRNDGPKYGVIKLKGEGKEGKLVNDLIKEAGDKLAESLGITDYCVDFSLSSYIGVDTTVYTCEFD